MGTEHAATVAQMHRAYGRGPNGRFCGGCMHFGKIDEPCPRPRGPNLIFPWCLKFGMPARGKERPARRWERWWVACGLFREKEPVAPGPVVGEDVA